MMSSQFIPSATSSRTSLTRMRVPRKVSLPWQILGLAQMYRADRFFMAILLALNMNQINQ
jgi:hypothetical protein